MATTKRTNGNYTIDTTADSSANVVLNTNTLFINGNLDVMGTTTTIKTVNTEIFDNIIRLNANVTGTPSLNAGIQVERGVSADVSLVWDETVDMWQITRDGTNFSNIASYTTVPPIDSLVKDPAPTLGGNLNVRSYQIYSSTSHVVTFNDNIAIATTTVAPTAVTGNVVLYAQTAGSGGSGLFVTNNAYSQQELATKSKAITYSIIFG